MFRLSKIGIAAVLGLTFVLSAFGSGAFAQSIDQNSARGISQTTVTLNQVARIGENQAGDRHPDFNGQGNRWNTGCGGHMNCHRPVQHTRCVREVKWVRFGHTVRRVVSRVCRRW